MKAVYCLAKQQHWVSFLFNLRRENHLILMAIWSHHMTLQRAAGGSRPSRSPHLPTAHFFQFPKTQPVVQFQVGLLNFTLKFWPLNCTLEQYIPWTCIDHRKPFVLWSAAWKLCPPPLPRAAGHPHSVAGEWGCVNGPWSASSGGGDISGGLPSSTLKATRRCLACTVRWHWLWSIQLAELWSVMASSWGRCHVLLSTAFAELWFAAL